MRAPISSYPGFTRKPDGSKVLDDVDESTWVYWEERTKESESRLGRAVRNVASLVADTHIVRERFRRAFMRVSIRRGAASLLLYERDQLDAAPLKVYDLTSVSDITKEDLPQKEALSFVVKDNSGKEAPMQVAVFGQILLRIHLGQKKRRTDTSLLASLGLGGIVGDKNSSGGGISSSSSSIHHVAGSGSGGGGGDGEDHHHSGDGDGSTSSTSTQHSVCLAFYTTADRDAWLHWFSELVVLRQRSIIEAYSPLEEDVEDASPSLFGFQTVSHAAIAAAAKQATADDNSNRNNGHDAGDLFGSLSGGGGGGSEAGAGTSAFGVIEQRIPICGERAFLRSARGRDALRDYARFFLETGARASHDVHVVGTVQASRNGGESFVTAELSGIVSAGEAKLKIKLGPITRESIVLQMSDYRIEASSSSERDLYLYLGNSTAIDTVNIAAAAAAANNKAAALKAAKQQQHQAANKGDTQHHQIATAMQLQQFNWTLRTNSFESRASTILWLRRVKGKGELAQSEAETFPYLRSMLSGGGGGGASSPSSPAIHSSSPTGGAASPSPGSKLRAVTGSTGFDMFVASPQQQQQPGQAAATTTTPREKRAGSESPELGSSASLLLPPAATSSKQQQKEPPRFDRVGDPLLDGPITPRSSLAGTDDDDGSASVSEFVPFCTYFTDVIESYIDDDARLHLFGSSVAFGGTGSLAAAVAGVASRGGGAMHMNNNRSMMARNNMSPAQQQQQLLQQQQHTRATSPSAGKKRSSIASGARAAMRNQQQQLQNQQPQQQQRPVIAPSGMFSRHDLHAGRKVM